MIGGGKKEGKRKGKEKGNGKEKGKETEKRNDKETEMKMTPKGKTKDDKRSAQSAICPPQGALPTVKVKDFAPLPVLMGTHWHRHHESQAWLRFESIALRHLQPASGPLLVLSSTTKSALREFGLANAMAVARGGAQRGREVACFLVGNERCTSPEDPCSSLSSLARISHRSLLLISFPLYSFCACITCWPD